ncbi:MAG: CAP domain-containing protein, partial [Pyrinomonadaceae bacterium]
LDEMVVTGRNNVFKLENCSKKGTPRLIFIRNGGANEIEVRRVSEDCKEQKVAAVTPGRMFESKTFADNVYRVYEKETARLLEEFVVQPRVSTYLIGAEANDDPRQGFLETTNRFRSGANLPALRLDDSLTEACQWFAEFMAAEDKGYPVHDVSEIRKDKPFPERNTSAKRLVYYGWEKKNKAHFEATILDTVPDIRLLGSHFALAWSSGNTHDAPFFDKDRTKYNSVGFGYAKAKSGEIKYYACAVFGKK